MRDYLETNRDRMTGELMEWLRVPSIAGVPEHVPDLVRSAHWLAGALRATGFPEVEVWEEENAPAVYARWCAAPGAPTVLIYSHHDVRAAKDEEWSQTRPFESVLRDGYVYGRGASDAKGQALAHVWAVRAHLAATGRTAPAVNLKFLVEGEEETGSAHLADILDTAVEVLSILAGDPVGPTRSAIPAVATVSLNIRTAPGQTSATVTDQLRRWVAETMDARVDYELTVAEEVSQEPYRTPDDLPAVELLAAAMEKGFGNPAGRMGNAGGGPAELLAREVGAPVLFFGTGLPEDHWHDSDERVAVDMLIGGAATLAYF